jgi:hypothetical protein
VALWGGHSRALVRSGYLQVGSPCLVSSIAWEPLENYVIYRRVVSLFLTVFLLVAGGLASATAPAFVMSCQYDKQTPLYRELEALYHAAFQRLGRQVDMVSLTNQRAITDVARGRADGTCLRAKSLVLSGPHANLVLVPEPLQNFTFDIWVLAEGSQYATLPEVVAGGGLVGYERGAWIVGYHLQQAVPKTKLVAVTGTKNGLSMLRAGRIQAFVHTRLKIDEALALSPSATTRVVRRAGTLASSLMYPVFNVRHEAWVAEFAAVLKQVLRAECAPTGERRWRHLCAFYQQPSASLPAADGQLVGLDSP